MFSVKSRILLAVIIGLLLVPAAAIAQQPQPSASPGDSFVSEKGFRSRVFEIKHRDPSNLVRVLMPLGSGFKGAAISSNADFKTVTVRDFPENIAAIEEAIKRLDVPEPTRPAVEFHVHVLIATNGGASSEQFPAELNDVIKQLQTTLSYKNYTLMTSQVIRAKEQGGRGVNNKGVAQLKLSADTAASKNPIFYEFHFENLTLDVGQAGSTKIQIGQFHFSMKVPLVVGQGTLQYESIGFNTPVNMREGEKVVVGTTSMEDKGIVVVLTGTIMK